MIFQQKNIVTPYSDENSFGKVEAQPKFDRHTL